MIRRSHSMILLIFGSRAPLAKLRNLSLSLRRGLWWCAVDCGSWTDCTWHQGVWRHWLEQAASSNSSWRMLAASRLKDKKRSWRRQTSVLNFLKSCSWTVLLDAADEDPDDTHAVQEEVPPPYLVICLSDLFFLLVFR